MARLLLLAAVLGALAGCGTSDDRDEVRAVAERFGAALDDADGATACAQLAADTVKELESRTGQSCDEAVTRIEYAGGEIIGAVVYATNAKVDLSSGQSAFLSREPDGWRLSAVACAPKEGKPRDRPFDCELEA